MNESTSHMRGRGLAALFCCLALFAGHSRAADFQARWSELPALLSGYQVSILLPGGGVVAGQLAGVRPDALVLDVTHVSGGAQYRKGLATVPRSSVTLIRATNARGAWGRRMGVLVGQIAGLILAGEFVGHVATSEHAGVPAFFAIDVGSTVVGYYLGKRHDQHGFELTVEPPSAADAQPTQQPATVPQPPPLGRRPPEQ